MGRFISTPPCRAVSRINLESKMDLSEQAQVAQAIEPLQGREITLPLKVLFRDALFLLLLSVSCSYSLENMAIFRTHSFGFGFSSTGHKRLCVYDVSAKASGELTLNGPLRHVRRAWLHGLRRWAVRPLGSALPRCSTTVCAC